MGARTAAEHGPAPGFGREQLLRTLPNSIPAVGRQLLVLPALEAWAGARTIPYFPLLPACICGARPVSFPETPHPTSSSPAGTERAQPYRQPSGSFSAPGRAETAYARYKPSPERWVTAAGTLWGPMGANQGVTSAFWGGSSTRPPFPFAGMLPHSGHRCPLSRTPAMTAPPAVTPHPGGSVATRAPWNGTNQVR